MALALALGVLFYGQGVSTGHPLAPTGLELSQQQQEAHSSPGGPWWSLEQVLRDT